MYPIAVGLASVFPFVLRLDNQRKQAYAPVES